MESQQYEPMPEPPKKLSARSVILLGIEFSYEFLKTTVFVILVAVFFRYFLVQPFIVVGESMEPNFHDKEYLLIDKLSYRFREPKRGEVVIFHPPQNKRESYIKRIIGLPGERVEIREGSIYINDKLLEESYIWKDGTKSFREQNMITKLGEDEFFVFGDNRDHSSDSREIGPVPKRNLQGRVVVVLLPLGNLRTPETPAYSLNASQSVMFDLVPLKS
ncbi:MAG TPA: signal peptidase I [bacterium]|jgi:signal peptidase I|nr:signal peptidase I [bacterium]HOR57292.1 signal peptidase I [bacterium]HPL56328.1 signal peptidase I [bacterium]HPM27856.1 signal peptidase I [bacterium]